MDKKQKKEPGMKEWAIIFAAGALLLLLSVPDLFHKEKEETTDTATSVQQREEQSEEYAERMERKLEEVLRKIDGVTSVTAMITVTSTTEKVVLQDTTADTEELTEKDGAGGERTSVKNTNETKAVLAGETPYLTKELTPEVEGVVVVISGVESTKILAITEAVQALFDVPAHKVKIINN
jgi:stage III sporulation protein AG